MLTGIDLEVWRELFAAFIERVPASWSERAP
jgi:hypothetical protein